MKRLLLLSGLLLSSCLLMGSSCGPKPPNPQPTPSPSSTPAPTAALLLTRNGKVFTNLLGQPVDLKGTARCCFTDNSPEDACDPGWALVSKCAVKDTADRGGNLIHVRLGPYRVQPDWGQEQISAGSPYLEVQGLADLTQWDPTFWSYMKDKVTYGASLGVRLELDLMDGWGIKWQKWKPNQFPQGHPWMRVSNLQHQDWISPAGTHAPAPGDVHDLWIRKVVDELGGYDSVIYQVGNEDGQIPGIVADWEVGTCNIVHDEEIKKGFKRHLCGSNVPELVANRAEIDYLTTHDDPPFSQAQCRDVTRPCRQNEDNNSYTGQLWGQLYCDAKSKGLYRDLWRAEMPRPEFNLAFTFLLNGCSGAAPAGCFDIPDQDAIQVLPKPGADQAVVDATNAALHALHPECQAPGPGVPGGNCPIDKPLQPFLQDFAAKVREDPSMCANIQTTPEGPVDEVCVGLKVAGTSRCDVCQGNHVYGCKSGCTTGTVSWAPGSYLRASDTWKRPGALIASTASATSATGPLVTPDWKHGQDVKPKHYRKVVPPTQ